MKYKHFKDITIEEIEKDLALMQHNEAYEQVSIYNLPYRVLLDNIERYWNEPNEETHKYVPLNPYYPFNGVPEQGEWDYKTDGHYTFDEWFTLTMRETGRTDTQGKKIVDVFVIPPQIQTLIDEKGKPFKLWDLETAAGLKGWVYYFMAYIMPYEENIPRFTVFDMYGDTKHTKQELSERKAYYMDLINQCKEQPELYKHGRQEISTPLELLEHEKKLINGYDLERTDTTTRAYRIETALQTLKQGACKTP